MPTTHVLMEPNAIEVRMAQPTDAPAVAALANEHTYQHLAEADRAGGFLTGSFTAPALEAMISSVPGQVAWHGDELVGFVVNSLLPSERYPPLVREIIARLPTLTYQQRALAEYRWFFYGPVLVQPAYRGQRLLRRLFRASQRALAGHFELGIAFIARENVVSLTLHTQGLGLERVGEVQFQSVVYDLLVFPVSSW
ncbi:MAG: GNAT family N-acetyltransferase [Janthinobacterium lividum]